MGMLPTLFLHYKSAGTDHIQYSRKVELETPEDCRYWFQSHKPGMHIWGRIKYDLIIIHTTCGWINRSVCVECPAGIGLLMWPASQPRSLKVRCLWVSTQVSTQENRCLVCKLRKRKASNGPKDSDYVPGLRGVSREGARAELSPWRQVTIALLNEADGCIWECHM